MFDSPGEPLPASPRAAEPGEGFRPELFFLKPWRGVGMVCDAFGIVSGRYEQWGSSRVDDDGLTVLEQNSKFSSGTLNTFEWKILSSAHGKVRARDLRTGKEARGERTPNGFLWRYKAHANTPFGRRLCQFSVLYNQTSANEACNFTTVSLMGVTVKSATSHFHHV